MKFWKYIIYLLFLGMISVWVSFFSLDDSLHIIACDVGQGDAVLVQKGKTQILFDGGPNNEVLGCLGKHIPFYDRQIEVVILTHPEYDHYRGLIEVFNAYNVDTFVASSLDSSSQEYQVLQDAVEASQARIVNPKSGMSISTSLICLDILWPSLEYLSSEAVDFEENVLGKSTTNTDKNTFSVVAKLRLGDFQGLFTGDITPEVAENIVRMGLVEEVNYIKVPHHGSKNGLTKSLLLNASPEVAVISVGEDNTYGHPHKEILNMLEEEKVLVKRTDLEGEVEVISDGKSWWFSR